MNPNFLDNNAGNDPRPNGQIFREEVDGNNALGPIELSILERVENGLIYSEDEIASQENKSMESEFVKNKYQGPKEIIFVSGWINIDSVYQRYFWGFLSKIAIGKIINKIRNHVACLFVA